MDRIKNDLLQGNPMHNQICNRISQEIYLNMKPEGENTQRVPMESTYIYSDSDYMRRDKTTPFKKSEGGGYISFLINVESIFVAA